jgi:acetylornithine deacetylase
MAEIDLRTKILQAVDAGFDEQIDFTRELVRKPSVRGQEATAQDFMAAGFRDHGFDVDRFKLDPALLARQPGYSPVSVSYDNAWSVVGSWRPRAPKGRSLIMNGHVDVVPTGPAELWTHQPFDPVIDGDWMYGRGAGDMKSGTAAMIFAIAALRRARVMPAGTVHMESVIEEECTGNGALSCMARGYDGDVVLIPEPSDAHLMSAQVGVIWMQVTVRGLPVHVSVAGTGQNAIEACAPLFAALHDLEAEWNKSDAKHEAFAEVDHPINVVVSKIEGGDWTSSVPSWCRFDVRVGLYPDVEVGVIQRRLEACLAHAARDHPFLSNNPPSVAWHGFLAPGYVLRGGDDAQRILEVAHRGVFDTPLRRTAFTGLTDARFRGLYGTAPGLVYGARAENIHGIDERVSLESIRKLTQAMALFIMDWCGVEAV